MFAASLLQPLVPALGRAKPSIPLTVEASIEMRRLDFFDAADESQMISYSPDGQRYLLRVVQDDLKAGGTWIEFLSGRTSGLDAAKPVSVGRLFITAERNRETGLLPPTHPALARIEWVGSDSIVFLWSDGAEPLQLMLLDAGNRKIRQLTRHSTSVTSFAVAAADRQTILYTLHPGLDREAQIRAFRGGFVVRNPDALNTLLEGVFAGEPPFENVTPYVLNLDSGETKGVACSDPICRFYGMAQVGHFSPDYEFWAVGWGSGNGKNHWRVLRFDARSATLTEIWKQPGLAKNGEGARWSPSGDRLILGPIEIDPELPRSVIEVEPLTGKMLALPVPADLLPVVQVQ